MTPRLMEGRTLVVGLGASGIAAARLLLERGARVIVNDRRARSELEAVAASLEAAGAQLELGHHDPELFTSVDRVVVSPGVPPLEALEAAEAAGIPVLSEIELAAAFIEGTIVAITGTNGKSTVTTLLGEICARSGRPTFVGGNLGTPLVEVVGQSAAAPDGFVVVELSSFQLERVFAFRPHLAIFLNLSEDHLDRYRSYGEYVAAKARIFRAQRREDFAIVPSGDALLESLAAAGAAEIHRYGGAEGEVRVQQGCVQDERSGLRLEAAELRLAGGHNLENACAAALGARLLGIAREPIEAVLRSFPGLPHRMAHLRDLGGVRYYDDSKATNVGAAVAALEGLGEAAGVVLIAGGRDKGGSYEPLREAFARRGRGAVLIGEAAERLEAALSPCGLPLRRAASMEQAVSLARTLAQPGDAVVLAPACSSYDMYRSFIERGEAFSEAVRALPEVL